MTYQYDIFLSYPRAGHSGEWVRNHFLPLLQGCLDDTLPLKPNIFIDQALPTGSEWPASIKDALLRSKLMVAVWTPPYFQSPWCLAEWQSMLARERFEADKGMKVPRGLVYPVIYSDGHHFAPEAKATQHRRDLTDFTYPYVSFKDSEKYLRFHDAMMEVASEIEEHLNIIPAWDPTWPLAEAPAATPTKVIGLPKL